VDALYIGIAPIGGGFDESWRSDVEAAIEAGCDVVSGLHYFLNGDEELVALADEHGVDLVDVREPTTISRSRRAPPATWTPTWCSLSAPTARSGR